MIDIKSFNSLIELTDAFPTEEVCLKYLESKKDFSSWIKDRIERYDLAENEDYVVFTEIGENSKGGRPKKEYALTLDAAKELSMVEGNEKGKQARKYFIACEKKLKGENPSYLIVDPIKRAEAWIQEEKERQALKEQAKQLAEENKSLENQIEEDAPKVIFAMAVTESKRSCLVAELAKIICQNGMEVGQNRMFKWLRKRGYLGTKGEYYNQPMQRWVEAGMFEIKKRTITKPNGDLITVSTPLVTGKGQAYLVNKFLREYISK